MCEQILKKKTAPPIIAKTNDRALSGYPASFDFDLLTLTVSEVSQESNVKIVTYVERDQKVKQI